MLLTMSKCLIVMFMCSVSSADCTKQIAVIICASAKHHLPEMYKYLVYNSQFFTAVGGKIELLKQKYKWFINDHVLHIQ